MILAVLSIAQGVTGFTPALWVTVAIAIVGWIVLLVKLFVGESKRIDSLESNMDGKLKLMESDLDRMKTALDTGLKSMRDTQDSALARMNQSLEHSLRIMEINYQHSIRDVNDRVDGIARIIDEYKGGQRDMNRRLDKMNDDERTFRHRLDMKLARALDNYDADPESKVDKKAGDGLIDND